MKQPGDDAARARVILWSRVVGYSAGAAGAVLSVVVDNKAILWVTVCCIPPILISPRLYAIRRWGPRR